MQQQPILTAEEVFALIKETLPDDETLRNAYNELAEKLTVVYRGLKPLRKEIFAVLKLGANYLRSRGIFVYLDYYKPETRSCYFRFIAGECGRVYERLKKQAKYLYDLSLFIEDHEEELPKGVIAKKKKIDAYRSEIESKLLWWLEELYRQGDKEALKSLCEEAWEFANEVDAFLERIKDLQRSYALAKSL